MNYLQYRKHNKQRGEGYIFPIDILPYLQIKLSPTDKMFWIIRRILIVWYKLFPKTYKRNK